MESTPVKNSKKTLIFNILFLLTILFFVSVTFYKIVIVKNYQMISQVSCNPQTESCFLYKCNPDVDGECPQENIYYKYISKNASTIDTCEKTEQKDGCKEELSCVTGESSCYYEYCDQSMLEEGEKCSDLKNY